ncbi:MAG TPA: NnrS family protein, partial [Rhodocyclaceae bacterium]|nr:NnrS family protein [Rhodocyclaceae bacterium]
LCVGAYWMPPAAGAVLTFTLATLLLVRFCFWHPHQALRRIDIGIMYLGYLALCAQLLLEGWGRLNGPLGIGSLATHVFTFGVMGLIIPAMLIRICNGHTGRKVRFDARDKAVLWLMMAACVLRLLCTQIFPALYPRWIEGSALLWAAAFALLAWRYTPYLWRPRLDGRLH